MIVQVERLWLFETLVSDPYIFEKTDGVDITMNSIDDRLIELLSIDVAIFYVDTILKGGLSRELEYGGEDNFPFRTNGKISAEYTIQFNLPLENEDFIEQMVGKEFSLVGMRRDLSLFSCFSRFTARPLSIDNEVLQRIELKASSGNHVLYELNSLNVDEVINVIGTPPPIYPPEPIVSEGFDYPIENPMN